jgi:hypothetical protein
MPRRYSEEEAQRIFALVADRQRATSGAEGLSLEELEEAARAAGLDPSLVAVAAAELDAAPHDEKRLLGAPIEVVRTRLLDGPLSEDAWASMVAHARREFGQPGMAGQIGRLREWTVINGGAKNGTVTRLTAEPVAEGTRITISRSIRETVFGFTLAAAIHSAMAVLFTVLAVAGVDPELWIAAGIIAGLGLVFGGGVQIGSRVWQRREASRFESLLDRLELVARDAPKEAAPPASVASLAVSGAAPRLSLDALDDAPETDGTVSGRTRTRT